MSKKKNEADEAITVILLIWCIVGGFVVGSFLFGCSVLPPEQDYDRATHWYINIYEYHSSRQQVNTHFWVFTPHNVLLSKGTGVKIIFDPYYYEEGQILNLYVECEGFLPVTRTVTLPSLFVSHAVGVDFGKSLGDIELIPIATPTVLVGVYDMLDEAELHFFINDVHYPERFGVGHYVDLPELTEYVGAVLTLYLPNGAVDPYLTEQFFHEFYTVNTGNGTLAVFLLGQLDDIDSFRIRIHYAFPGELVWKLYHKVAMEDYLSVTFGVPTLNGTVVIG